MSEIKKDIDKVREAIVIAIEEFDVLSAQKVMDVLGQTWHNSYCDGTVPNFGQIVLFLHDLGESVAEKFMDVVDYDHYFICSGCFEIEITAPADDFPYYYATVKFIPLESNGTVDMNSKEDDSPEKDSLSMIMDKLNDIQSRIEYLENIMDNL